MYGARSLHRAAYLHLSSSFSLDRYEGSGHGGPTARLKRLDLIRVNSFRPEVCIECTILFHRGKRITQMHRFLLTQSDSFFGDGSSMSDFFVALDVRQQQLPDPLFTNVR
jgi:hypothetical protein